MAFDIEYQRRMLESQAKQAQQQLAYIQQQQQQLQQLQYQQQMLAQQPQMMPPQQPQQQQMSQVLAGYIVGSIDEARAARIAMDGTIQWFPCPGADEIYSKQMALDGSPDFRVYRRVYETPAAQQVATPENGVHGIDELRQRLDRLEQELYNTKEVLKNAQHEPDVSDTASDAVAKPNGNGQSNVRRQSALRTRAADDGSSAARPAVAGNP